MAPPFQIDGAAALAAAVAAALAAGEDADAALAAALAAAEDGGAAALAAAEDGEAAAEENDPFAFLDADAAFVEDHFGHDAAFVEDHFADDANALEEHLGDGAGAVDAANGNNLGGDGPLEAAWSPWSLSGEDEEEDIQFYRGNVLGTCWDEEERPARLSDSDCSYHYSDDDLDRATGILPIYSLPDVSHVVRFPKKYVEVTQFIISAFKFVDASPMLEGMKKVRKDHALISVGNIKRLQQAVKLHGTMERLYTKLYRVGSAIQERLHSVGRSFQERRYLYSSCYELVTSLSEFMPDLASDRTSLQPRNVLHYTDAICTALRALMGCFQQDSDGTARLTGLEEFSELNQCVLYIQGRIKALDQEIVNYPSAPAPALAAAQEVDNQNEDFDDENVDDEDDDEEEEDENVDDDQNDKSCLRRRLTPITVPLARTS